MSWINEDSYKLVKTASAKEFARKNNLQLNGDLSGANFFNEYVLIKIYEERAYLHADYYDLKNYRWWRGLENYIVGANLIPRSKAVEIYELTKKEATEDVLRKSSMEKFLFYIRIIDIFLQDFLAGDFKRYESLLNPLEESHKLQIDNFKRRFL